MKNYMANKSFRRGVETPVRRPAAVFVGNTDHTVPYMLKHSDLFDPLPDKFHDSAFPRPDPQPFPAWVDVIRGEMFSSGYGFMVDHCRDPALAKSSHDFRIAGKALPGRTTSQPDQTYGVNKTFSA